MADNQSLTSRQKLTVGIFLLVLIFLGWQGYGMIRGRMNTTSSVLKPNQTAMTSQAPPVMPKKTENVPTINADLMKVQQVTQEKYIAAVDALQLLKVAREIAETNQAIMVAKLASAKATKGIADLNNTDTSVPPGAYAKNLSGTGSSAKVSGQSEAPQPTQVNYTVISVSQIQYQWTAVLGYQGNLYNVKVGDILPADGSKVVAIGRSSVTLEKDGETKKISLVPII